jgi:membrane fusion protein (multidrug efflux system)
MVSWMKNFNFFEFKYWPQIGVVFLFALGYGAYRYFAYYDTRSNDAYVSAHVINMSSLVSGSIIQIYVQENQKVKKGDKLIKIDPLPYLYEVQQAKAKLNIARLNYEQEKLKLLQAELNLRQNQKTQVDKQAAEQQLKIAKLNLNENEILEAQTELDQANYSLEHTTLIAPEDGYITNFNLRKGQYLQAGTGLFAFIETKKWWIVTRYRETAIRLIKPGDKAKIKIDMYPGKVFHGTVQSIGWGINRVQSGNVATSTLVYLEATEDWIRIAQRFPVFISIDDLSDEYPMRIGASATTITYR